jgi:hypothetical protein
MYLKQDKNLNLAKNLRSKIDLNIFFKRNFVQIQL